MVVLPFYRIDFDVRMSVAARVAEAYLAHAVTPHKAVLVDVALHTVDTSFGSILPHDVIAFVAQPWLIGRVLCNP